MVWCVPMLVSIARMSAAIGPRCCRGPRLPRPGHCGAALGVVSSDTCARAWREGQTHVAIGVAGVEALRHFEGQLDPTGYELRVTMLATADELASAAGLGMGKSDGVPVALVRGLQRALGPGSSSELIRPAATDLFR